MIQLGPYRFTEQDAERTLFNGRTLFDLLPGGFPPDPSNPAAPHRARAEQALDDLAASNPPAALAEVWAAWHDAVADLRAAGAFGPTATGAVGGLFTGSGGVPKGPQGALEVGWAGAAGDRQNDRKNHGRPWQALCLWSSEVVAAFAEQGHPVVPGGAGENISTVGIPWDRAVPGTELQIGGVRAVISSYALPCKTTAANFLDGHFDLMHHRHGPVSRVYATVLEPGRVEVGDPLVLEPDA
ncbi:MAG: MOSC domain-containing protein [Acidimicrobiales bacterium]|nr:MOSC domain-containing protein [Acidimicrobiales bacterium]